MVGRAAGRAGAGPPYDVVEPIVPATSAVLLRRVSWGASAAGAAIALVLQMALSLFGIAAGLGTLQPFSQDRSFADVTTGTLVWVGLSVIVSLFLGGWIAARLSGVPRKFEAVMHGLLTWAVVTLASILLLTVVAGGVVGGALGMIGGGLRALGGQPEEIVPAAVGLATEAAEATRSRRSVRDVRSEAVDLLAPDDERERRRSYRAEADVEEDEERPLEDVRPSRRGEVFEGLTLEALRDENERDLEAAERRRLQAQPSRRRAERRAAERIFDRLMLEDGELAGPSDRREMVEVLVERTGMTRSEARDTVDRWARELEGEGEESVDVPAAVEEVTSDVTEAASRVIVFAGVGMLLGALAAAIGAFLGRPKLTVL